MREHHQAARSDAAALRDEYDAVVIGSGIGGLAAGALLARGTRRRVLVLEKHWTLGGQTHEFSRPGGWHWDVGLHYVGELQPGTRTRALMDFVTGDAPDWRPMPPGYDRFVYPDLTFVARADAEQYEADLRALFPHDAAGLRAYFRDVRRAAAWLRERVAVSGMMPRVLEWPVRAHLALGRGLALQTTGQWLAAHIRDPKLRALLASQWGDYGLPPALSAFAIHSLIVTHYFEGALYPTGGAQNISRGAERVIEEHGGRCLTGAEVTRILVHDARARGVRVRMHRSEVEIEAPIVVSDAGAHITYRRLLEKPLYPELDACLDGLSSQSLYVGFSESPARLGIDGSNHWIYEGYDHDALAAAGVDDPVSYVYLSFPSLKGGFEPHTAELLTFKRYDAFLPWSGRRWKKRGADYEELKERLAAEMLDVVERRIPGFRDIVAYHEMSTPLTMETFTSRAQGMMYGVPATPERFAMKCLDARTPIRGLYLSGSDVVTLGIVGALVGGLVAAIAAAGTVGAARIIKALARGVS